MDWPLLKVLFSISNVTGEENAQFAQKEPQFQSDGEQFQQQTKE